MQNIKQSREAQQFLAFILSSKCHLSTFPDFCLFVLVYLGGPVPRDIYQRIKKLEDKILELEGLSPEYFQSVSCSGKRRKVQPPHQNYSLAELDEKINAIKQALLRKTKESKSKEAEQLLR
ncbi:hypothetical protein ASZ78_003504 [Callipepla squamata]|uniref:Uncharacterized protein n=1 Tax=Callipepla squamata TaxID=9009 RepID=A0A226NH31_CALSU|nr:hypothetical protein ASZ78_003504 [Callipepla squamata]